MRIKVRNIKLDTLHLVVFCIIILLFKVWINIIQPGRVMHALTDQAAILYVQEKGVPLVAGV